MNKIIVILLTLLFYFCICNGQDTPRLLFKQGVILPFVTQQPVTKQKQQKPEPAKLRCFLVGYLGTSNVNGGVYSGGSDTCLKEYPNRAALKQMIESRFNLKGVMIVAITEYALRDRWQFWHVDTVSRVYEKHHP